jgi:hypothetical protein
MRVVLSAGIMVLALSARAQPVSPPPMVPSDPVEQPVGVLQPPTIANALIDPNAPQPVPQPMPGQVPGALQPQVPTATAEQPAQRNGRLTRIGASLLIGGGLGAATAIVGGFVGGEYLRPGITSIGNIWTGGAIGFAIGAPIGVLISGLAFDGNAPWWAPVLGDALGVAVGAVAIAFGGPDALPAVFALPLLGSIIGYEAGSAENASVSPSVTVLPGGRGAVAGVSGRW